MLPEEIVESVAEAYEWLDGDYVLDAKERQERKSIAARQIDSLVSRVACATAEGAMNLSHQDGKTAAELALDDIAGLCGVAGWEYPGQVVRDVKGVVELLRFVYDHPEGLNLEAYGRLEAFFSKYVAPDFRAFVKDAWEAE